MRVPRPVDAAWLESKLSARLWIGLLLLSISLVSFIGVQRWMASRTFVAVDMRISLAPGHIMAGPFNINLKNWYQIEIDTGSASFVDPKCYSYDRVKAQWALYRDGQVVAHWHESTPYTELGGFDSEKDTYNLDLEILSETSCLNSGKPRLIVHTDKGSYEQYRAPILWASALGVALGASLLALGVVASCEGARIQSARVTQSRSIGQCFQWAQKLALTTKFSTLPPFAAITVPGLTIIIAVFVIFSSPISGQGPVRRACETWPACG